MNNVGAPERRPRYFGLNPMKYLLQHLFRVIDISTRRKVGNKDG